MPLAAKRFASQVSSEIPLAELDMSFSWSTLAWIDGCAENTAWDGRLGEIRQRWSEKSMEIGAES
jgi:hypothetical protein